MIVCENELCIYQEDNACTIDSIEIDSSGACISCNQVSLDKKTLENAKKRLLDELNDSD